MKCNPTALDFRFYHATINALRVTKELPSRAGRLPWFVVRISLTVVKTSMVLLTVEQEISGNLVYQLLEQLGKPPYSSLWELRKGIEHCQGMWCIVTFDHEKKVTGIFNPGEFGL